MLVHILTHTVVDNDDHTEFYSMVSGHLEKLQELGVVKAVAVHHGDLPEVSILPGLGHTTPTPTSLCKIAAESIAAARALSS